MKISGEGETSTEEWAPALGGLILPVTDRRMLFILTAIDTASVHVTCIQADEEPPINLEDWDDVAVTTLRAEFDNTLYVAGLFGGDASESLISDTGDYRIRVSGARRDGQLDDIIEEEASEYYLVEIWPVTDGTIFDEVVKMTSKSAAYLQENFG
ncbi:hypothetical protein [Microbacterium sp.]|uniref:hypothetical protein n=1 Tax=Microbacterium sp. TaxID=51671 RepID=UPI003340134F